MPEITDVIAAVAALGTAAFALVDSSKAFWGGISNAGFGHIKRVVTGLVVGESPAPLGLDAILATLRANWLNGTPLSDQKAIAKSLIKLRMTPKNAALLAQATGVDSVVLESVAGKIASGTNLSLGEADVYGRFDLILTAMLDEGYQRADQKYRNSSKAMAVPVSVALAIVGGWQINGSDVGILQYLGTQQGIISLLVGLLATPVAPISKDLSSALATAVRTMQVFRK
jgi:hypothetical protein